MNMTEQEFSPQGYPLRTRSLSNQTFTISTSSADDPRIVGYAMYGSSASSAPTIIYIPGTPSSRFEAAEWHPTALRLGVRVVTFDRPGTGLSTFVPGRKILDIVAYVRALAKHLEINEYYVVGGSGGGPYALACSKELSEAECKGVGVLAGIGPWGMGTKGMRGDLRVLFNLIAWWKWGAWYVLEYTVGQKARLMDDGEFGKLMQRAWESALTSSEKEIVLVREEGELGRMMMENVRETWKQGVEGNLHDLRLFTKPWGFNISEIKRSGVRFWYGSLDESTPPYMGQKMCDLMHGVYKEFEGDTHLTIVGRHLEELIKDLLAME